MTKKEILVTLGIFLVVLGGVAGGVLFMVQKQNTAQAKASETETLSQSSEQTLPLNETTPQNQGNQGDNLTVVAGANTANPGQLGSGQVASSQDNASSNSAPNVPGPESFGQYEKYKDNQSGLFGDIVVGNGAEALNGKKMAVYYKGWLTNGQLFDQSRAGDDGKLQPFVLTLGQHQVIRGWEEALLGMKVGGTRRIIVPPAAGYGATPQGSIPANSVLVFDVELLAVQ